MQPMTIERAAEIFGHICSTFPESSRDRLERLMQVNQAFRLAVFHVAAESDLEHANCMLEQALADKKELRVRAHKLANDLQAEYGRGYADGLEEGGQ